LGAASVGPPGKRGAERKVGVNGMESTYEARSRMGSKEYDPNVQTASIRACESDIISERGESQGIFGR